MCLHGDESPRGHMRTCGAMNPADSLTQRCDHFLIMGKNGSADNGKPQFIQFWATLAIAASWWGFFFSGMEKSVLAQWVYVWGIVGYECMRTKQSESWPSWPLPLTLTNSIAETIIALATRSEASKAFVNVTIGTYTVGAQTHRNRLQFLGF